MYKWLTDLKVINGIRFIIRRLEISMAMTLRQFWILKADYQNLREII